jgi:ferredoxin
MPVRQVIQIDEEKCTGCALCATACHEGAIGIVDGKARLLRDDYCDGMGDCLPSCPTGAITFIEREAAAYDEAAVAANMRAHAAAQNAEDVTSDTFAGCTTPDAGDIKLPNWPIQVKLTPVSSPAFDGAHLLIAADCTAFAHANFAANFIAGRTCLIACPKLDAVDYTEKLTAIFSNNNVQSVTVTRMIVPCCGGIENAAKQAVLASGKNIPVNVVTMGLDGQIV